ncbi:MAG TPA: hypothetical protein VFQ35_06555 [Polyangiaceae bacterium]|nr:hypothetical protein [Polyangiaceae bacterium]
MTLEAPFADNRVILLHFDTYSAALVFARFGKSVLLPEPLPATAVPMTAPSERAAAHEGDEVLRASVSRYGLNPEELGRMRGFDEWVQTDSGPIRIHLLRFTTFLAPAEAIAPHGGVFAPLSELRGIMKVELPFVRQAFNLILGGESSSR